MPWCCAAMRRVRSNGHRQTALRREQAAVERLEVHPPLVVGWRIHPLAVLPFHGQKQIEAGEGLVPDHGEDRQAELAASPVSAVPGNDLVAGADPAHEDGLAVAVGQVDVVLEPLEGGRRVGRFMPKIGRAHV